VTPPPLLPRISQALAWLRERYPWFRWMMRWGVSAASILSGLATLLIFRRGLDYFPWFIGYLLLAWLAAVVFTETRQTLAARTRVLGRVVEYAVQTLLHGLFLFLLPIYYGSATLASRNVWFLLALLGVAVLTAVDPWYRAALRRLPFLELTCFGLGLFASLAVALPLFGLRSHWALVLSGLGSMLALTPIFRRGASGWRDAGLRAVLAGLVLSVSLWWVRDWIPPVPLQLTRGTFAQSVSNLEPIYPVSRATRSNLQQWERLHAFLAVAAPAGLREPVYHVWWKNGHMIARMLVAVVTGGRPGGFRTYSWKRVPGEDPTGIWQVEMRTAHGQLIGRIHLLVLPD
jgi:hypothetical protein